MPLSSQKKQTNNTPQGGHPLSTVYSFVPIPGAQQHKRPRRRYEEIERMYKCGWNGCEKAYGTLNHLNAHVTMQSHGAKRTPEGTCCQIPWVWACLPLFWWPLQTWRARLAHGSVLVQRHFGGVPAALDSLLTEANHCRPLPTSLGALLTQVVYNTNLTRCRIQRDSQRVEGEEEGGGGCPQGRG